MENEIANEILKQVKGLGKELNEFRKETNERFDRLEARVDSLEEITKENTIAISKLETKVDKLETKVDGLETKVDNLETKVDNLEGKFDKLEQVTNENTKAIKTLEQVTNENTKAIKTLEKVTEDNTLEIIKLKAKMDDFGEQRKKDRLELMDVLQRMDESISKRFDKMDAQFEKIYALQAFNDVEHAEYRQAIKVLKMKDNIFARRLQDLEDWKKDCGGDLFAV